MMNTKSVIVVKRQWHNPEILAFVNDEEVGAKMQVTDFVRALIDEIYQGKGRVVMLSKNDALVKALEGTDSILREMKQTTANVV